MSTCPQDCTKLYQNTLGLLKAITNCSKSHKWIGFNLLVPSIEKFIPTKIKCTNGDGPPFADFTMRRYSLYCSSSEGRNFSEEIRDSVRNSPTAQATTFNSFFHFLRCICICPDIYLFTIGGLCRKTRFRFH